MDSCASAEGLVATDTSTVGYTGLPKDKLTSVYTAAITKAGQSKSQKELANAFVSAYHEINSVKGKAKPKIQVLTRHSCGKGLRILYCKLLRTPCQVQGEQLQPLAHGLLAVLRTCIVLLQVIRQPC